MPQDVCEDTHFAPFLLLLWGVSKMAVFFACRARFTRRPETECEHYDIVEFAHPNDRSRLIEDLVAWLKVDQS